MRVEKIHEDEIDFFEEETKVYPKGALPVLIKGCQDRHRKHTVKSMTIVSALVEHMNHFSHE